MRYLSCTDKKATMRQKEGVGACNHHPYTHNEDSLDTYIRHPCKPMGRNANAEPGVNATEAAVRNSKADVNAPQNV